MKVVAPWIEAERLTRLAARDQAPTAALRRRAQAVELSSRGYRLTAMAALLEVPRETVCGWLDGGEAQGRRGLDDLPRAGRPPVFTAHEAEPVRAELEQSPRQWRQVPARRQERLGKTARRPPRRRVIKQSRAGAGSVAGARLSRGATKRRFGPSKPA